MTELTRSSQFCEVKETTSALPVRVLMKVFICLLNCEDNECVTVISEKIMTVNTLQMGTMHLYFVIFLWTNHAFCMTTNVSQVKAPHVHRRYWQQGFI
jgi:hypothetical protein